MRRSRSSDRASSTPRSVRRSFQRRSRGWQGFFHRTLAFAEGHPKSEAGDRVKLDNQFVDRCGRSGEHGMKRSLQGRLGEKQKQEGQLITGIK